MILFKVNSKSSIYVRLLYSMAVLCLLTALSSCSDDDAPAEIIPNPDSEIYFTKSLDFTSDSGEAILSFTTNKDWSINVSQSGGDVSWCTVFPNKGKAGENQVLVKVIRNEGVDDRNVVLNLAAGDLTKSIVVTQKQKDAITLTTAKFEVDKNGGEIQVEVKANVTYEVVIPEQYQSWIREGSGSGQIIMGDKGHNQMHESATRTDMDRTMRKFYISKSEEYDKREGEIIFRSGELEEVLKVYQTGGGILLLTKNEYTVSDKGEQITVELNSNFDFDVKMPQVDWITTTVTRSVSSHTLYYTIAPNETYDKREAEIIYYDRNDKSVADTLKIVQVQKDAILLSQKEYDITAKGETIEISVETNVNYNIHIDEENSQWIKLVQNVVTKSFKQDRLFFHIEENSEVKSRVGNIVFTSIESTLADTIRIIQEAKQIEEKHVKVYVEKAGTLKKLLNVEANLITHLEISGFINGTDLRLIREMAGIDYYGNPTLGQLRELDIAQATICSGGTNYSQYGSSVNIDNIIPGGCFSHTNLISIYLPFNTKKIEAQAFFFSEKLENISIPDDCRSIGWESFSACGLISVNIPRNVSFIDKLAFNRCYKLVSINVDSENRWYASIDGMLCDKKQETLIYYPAAGKKIINIPNTVKEINEYAFYCSIYQEKLNIPSETVTIPYGIFKFLSGLSFIDVDVNSACFTSIDGVLYDKSVSELIACPRLKDEITIPDGIQTISPFAFYSCQNLRVINMPNSITMLGEAGFWGCNSLTDINFSDNITFIDDNAFWECTSLTSMLLPKSIAGIGDNAFTGCTNLTKIYINREEPPFIEKRTFYRTNGELVIYVPKGCKERYKNSETWRTLNIIEME
ncbi:leucine-rich repeat protein [Bacteroides uniformis]|uniref:leucine-rich repeat protein n=2 Tax=Bacteroides uniformis TaxID=820 RepID=UPI00321C1328